MLNTLPCENMSFFFIFIALCLQASATFLMMVKGNLWVIRKTLREASQTTTDVFKGWRPRWRRLAPFIHLFMIHLVFESGSQQLYVCERILRRQRSSSVGGNEKEPRLRESGTVVFNPYFFDPRRHTTEIQLRSVHDGGHPVLYFVPSWPCYPTLSE